MIEYTIFLCPTYFLSGHSYMGGALFIYLFLGKRHCQFILLFKNFVTSGQCLCVKINILDWP